MSQPEMRKIDLQYMLTKRIINLNPLCESSHGPPRFFVLRYHTYESTIDNIWKTCLAGLVGVGMGVYRHREKWVGSEILTFTMAYAENVKCLDTYYIYVSIGSCYYKTLNGKMGTMEAWYVMTSPPESACLLTRLFVHRLTVENFTKFYLLACSIQRDPPGTDPSCAENRVFMIVFFTGVIGGLC